MCHIIQTYSYFNVIIETHECKVAYIDLDYYYYPCPAAWNFLAPYIKFCNMDAARLHSWHPIFCFYVPKFTENLTNNKYNSCIYKSINHCLVTNIH